MCIMEQKQQVCFIPKNHTYTVHVEKSAYSENPYTVHVEVFLYEKMKDY